MSCEGCSSGGKCTREPCGTCCYCGRAMGARPEVSGAAKLEWGERCAWVAFSCVALAARLADRDGIGRVARDAGQWFRDAREQLRWAEANDAAAPFEGAQTIGYRREDVDRTRSQLGRVAGDVCAEASVFADALIAELRER